MRLLSMMICKRHLRLTNFVPCRHLQSNSTSLATSTLAVNAVDRLLQTLSNITTYLRHYILQLTQLQVHHTTLPEYR
jgi:hypothetical protein